MDWIWKGEKGIDAVMYVTVVQESIRTLALNDNNDTQTLKLRIFAYVNSSDTYLRPLLSS